MMATTSLGFVTAAPYEALAENKFSNNIAVQDRPRSDIRLFALEVPGSVVVGLIDTIKTRVLRFSLELKDELGEVHDNRLREPGGFALVGCTVSPGFDFADFEMANRSALLSAYPQHRSIIERLTREAAEPAAI
jgi:hypothetical protein